MKKRVFKLVSVFLLVVSLAAVAACSKSDGKAGNVSNEVTDAAKSQTDAEPTVTPAADTSSEETGSGDEGNSSESTEEVKQEPKEVKVGDLPLVEGGIKGVFEKYGMITGTCIHPGLMSQTKYTEHILENYNSVTMENDMKPDYILNKNKSIEAGDLVVEFSQNTLNMLEWAKNNGLGVRGHTIIWHSQTPQWIFHEDFDTSKPKVDRETMLKRMESYIKQVFEKLDELGYMDIIYAYDVVNEAIMENGTLRDSDWRRIIGDDYIWYAFYYADKYAPESCKLFYNDYNEQFKTQHVVKLAQSLVTEDGRYLIDGIGCQGHLYTKDSIDDYMNTLEAFSALGLDVQITELDVSLGTWTNILLPTKDNLKEQGRWYYELINRILESNEAGKTRVSGITFWGISDSNSWRSDRSPLLFDRMFKPKYAYFGVVQQRENAGFEE